MSKEELLKPRYKVIAEYPLSEFSIGDLLQITENNDPPLFYIGMKDERAIHVWMREIDIQKYPHLFKKLEWWEEREEKDMPMFMKQTERRDSFDKSLPDKYIKVKKHFNAGNGEWRDDSSRIFCAVPDETTIGTDMNYCDFLPATESEYNEYKSKN